MRIIGCDLHARQQTPSDSEVWPQEPYPEALNVRLRSRCLLACLMAELAAAMANAAWEDAVSAYLLLF